MSADDVITHNTTLQSVAAASPKPSFLLWDKVYQKLNSEEEERWLLRAVEVVLPFFKADILRDETARFVVAGLAALKSPNF